MIGSSSGARQVCMTCQHFGEGVDEHCRTMLGCNLRQGQIQQGEHITSSVTGHRWSRWKAKAPWRPDQPSFPRSMRDQHRVGCTEGDGSGCSVAGDPIQLIPQPVDCSEVHRASHLPTLAQSQVPIHVDESQPHRCRRPHPTAFRWNWCAVSRGRAASSEPSPLTALGRPPLHRRPGIHRTLGPPTAQVVGCCSWSSCEQGSDGTAAGVVVPGRASTLGAVLFAQGK